MFHWPKYSSSPHISPKGRLKEFLVVFALAKGFGSVGRGFCYGIEARSSAGDVSEGISNALNGYRNKPARANRVD
jgi:hypothetical protein